MGKRTRKQKKPMKDFFISYAHGKDQQYVPRTVAFYHDAVKEGLRPWIDYYHMKDNCRSTMKNGIRQSTAFLALVNSDYKKSPNCNFELITAKQLGKPILLINV